MATEVDIDRFYRALMIALGEFGRKGGTGIGSAAIVKRVALEHGIEAAKVVSVPRMTRAEQEQAGVAGISHARARRAAGYR